jgi:hypothetical protein
MFGRRNSDELNQTQQMLPATTDKGSVERLEQASANPDVNQAIPSRFAASRGLTQMFGLDIRAAILTVIVDLMVFAGDTFSLEALLPLGIVVAGILGVIVYKIQVQWYKDDRESALIKAMIVSLLTAIPVPLSPLMAIPGGLIGMVRATRRK